MGEHPEEVAYFLESVLEKVTEKLPGHDSSFSDSDDEKSKKKKKPKPSSISSSIQRLFGREKPIHLLFGGGKSADVILWRNKQTSGVLVGATVIWLLFEWLGYHLLTLICHVLILGLTILFVWSNALAFVNKQPMHIPQISFSEQLFQDVASAVRFEINRLCPFIHDVASGRDLKKFLMVVAVPVLYEKYEDQVDALAFKAMDEAKKHYRTFDAKVLSKIPRGPLKDKKF